MWTKERVLRVLVAEHDRERQHHITSLLTPLGHHVTVVRDGGDAVAAATRDRFDVVFVDPVLPDVDGLAATMRIRADVPSRDQPFVVAVTASERPGDLAALWSAGMDAHVVLPLHRDNLVAVLSPLTRAASWARAQDVRTRITDLLGGSPTPAEKTLLVKVIDSFLAGSANATGELVTDIAAGDAAAASAAAHRLKGSAGNVGARVLAELSGLLEAQLRTGAVIGPCSLLSRIRYEAEQSRVTLAELREELLTRQG